MKLHNTLHNLFSSSKSIRGKESRRMRRIGRTAHVKNYKRINIILEGRYPFKRAGERNLYGIIILKYTKTEISHKIVRLVQDWTTCGYLVDTVVGLRGPQKTEHAVSAHSQFLKQDAPGICYSDTNRNF
jgi:hypothetical protein